MYNGKNLLNFGGQNPPRYACKVAGFMFGKELLTKVIVLPDSPERQSNREPITDEDPRIGILERKFLVINLIKDKIN